MDAALKAIATPRRREILDLVRDDERTAGEIARHFEVTWPAISQHLAVLREAGLVRERRDGRRRFYRADPAPLAEIRTFLDTFWDPRLLTLQREAEAEERQHARD